MTLSEQIRSRALRGANLLNLLCFSGIVFMCAGIILVALTWVPSWFWTISVLGTEASRVLQNGTGEDLTNWLRMMIGQWEQARAMAPVGLYDYIAITAMALIFFIFGMKRFEKPSGFSYFQYEKYKKPAKILIDEFGYYEDIKSYSGSQFTQRGKTIFLSTDNSRKFISNPDNQTEKKKILFFMSHEYAHSLSYDNVLASAFKVLFIIISASAVLLSIAPVLTTVMISVPTTDMQFLFFLSVIALTFVAFLGITLPIWLFYISAFKGREYFADRIAYQATHIDTFPYDHESKPDYRSEIWSKDPSKIERLHYYNDKCMHRGLIIPTGLFLLSITRTIYLIVCPTKYYLGVFFFDVAFIALLAGLWTTLPKKPQDAPPAVLPWLLMSIGQISVFLTLGIPGTALLTLNLQVVSEAWGQTASLPAMFLTAYFVFGLFISIGKKVFGKYIENGTPIKGIVKRLILRTAMAPAQIISGASFLLFTGLATMLLSDTIEGLIKLFQMENWRIFLINTASLFPFLASTLAIYHGFQAEPIRINEKTAQEKARPLVKYVLPYKYFIVEGILLAFCSFFLITLLVNGIPRFINSGGGSFMDLLTMSANYPDLFFGAEGILVYLTFLVTYSVVRAIEIRLRCHL